MALYDKIFKPKEYTLANGKKIEEKASRTPLVLLILLVASIVSIKVTGFNLTTLAKRGNQFWVILGKMFPPDPGYIPSIWGPLFDTIKMSIIGSLVGALIAIPVAMLASSNIIKNKVVIVVVRLLFSVARTLPTLVTALIATFIFGLGTTAGSVSIAIFTFAYVGKLLYEQIETVDMGPFEAMEAMGRNPWIRRSRRNRTDPKLRDRLEKLLESRNDSDHSFHYCSHHRISKLLA